MIDTTLRLWFNALIQRGVERHVEVSGTGTGLRTCSFACVRGCDDHGQRGFIQLQPDGDFAGERGPPVSRGARGVVASRRVSGDRPDILGSGLPSTPGIAARPPTPVASLSRFHSPVAGDFPAVDAGVTRKRHGPPSQIPDRCVDPELRALARRPIPLIDRLEALRDSTALAFNSAHRKTLQEAIDVIREAE